MNKQQAQCPASSVCPTDFSMPYSPALLLDAQFVPSLQNHPEFSLGCEWGFDGYFDCDDHKKVYTGIQVKREVTGEMLGGFVDSSVATTLGWRAGFVFGWLSALALSQYQEAIVGLDRLLSLLDGLD